ncbi:MAG: leucine-rich repeat protein [Lachnospiraceae bacterium]|nr:leucine-rich repeat protein [Lachnospiraceae bacterium]
MLDIINIENHIELLKEISDVRKFLDEGLSDDACFHLRKALEYIVFEFLRENPDCVGEDLFSSIVNLQKSGRDIPLIDNTTCKLFHEIRTTANAQVHFNTSEKKSIDSIGKLFERFLIFLDSFCEEYPEPSEKELPTYIERDEDDIPTPIIRYSQKEFGRIWSYSANAQEWVKSRKEGAWKRLVWLEEKEEYIYSTRDGICHIDSKRLVKDIDKKVLRIEKSERHIPDEKGGIVNIPGFLQYYYGYSNVYMDGLEVWYDFVNWNYVVAEALLLFEELILPNEEMRFLHPEKMYEDMVRYESAQWKKRINSEIKEPKFSKLILSAKTDISSDFRWTDYAECIAINESEELEENSTIVVDENGSIYTYGYKELLHFHGPYEGDVVIKDGVEIIGEKAFDGIDNGLESLIFPSTLKCIKSGALCKLLNKKIVVPDSVEILNDAFNETTQVFYMSDLTQNINKLYDAYLERVELEKKRSEELQREREKREQERIELERKEAERVQRELEEEKKRLQQKADEERKRKNNTIIFVAIGIFAFVTMFLLLIIADVLLYAVGPKSYSHNQIYVIDDEFRVLCENNDGEKEFSILEYVGNEKEVIIPEEIDGYVITNVRDTAFVDNDNVKSVLVESAKIKESIKFTNCINLEKVEYPSSIEKFQRNSFVDCPNVEEIIIPDSCYLSPVIFEYTSDFYTDEVVKILRVDNNGKTHKEECPKGSISDSQSYWTIDNSIEYEFSSYEGVSIVALGKESKVVIPRRINGYNVYEIQDISNDYIKKLDMSLCSELQYNRKIRQCENLQEIIYPSTVKRIRESDIIRCPNLKKIVVYEDCEVDSSYEEMGIKIEYIK